MNNTFDEWIDLSHEIHHDMPVWAGDEAVSLISVSQLKVHGFNNSQLCIGMHCGTHIDGPLHMTEHGSSISAYPISYFVSEGVLLDMQQDIEVIINDVDAMDLEDKIVLLYFNHSVNWGQADYFTHFPELDFRLARLLASKRIRMVGMDTPSPDREPYQIHCLFGKQGIFMIENLTNLHQLLNVNAFDVVALPLKINADSSPARVIARPKCSNR